eukprot:51553-Prorocentrum_minimum.AAC.1
MADGCGDEQAHTGPAQRPTQTEAVAQAHQGALQQAAGTMAPSGIQTRSCDGYIAIYPLPSPDWFTL